MKHVMFPLYLMSFIISRSGDTSVLLPAAYLPTHSTGTAFSCSVRHVVGYW